MTRSEPPDVPRGRPLRPRSGLRAVVPVGLAAALLPACWALNRTGPVAASQPDGLTAGPTALFREQLRMGREALGIIEESVKIGAPVRDPSTVFTVWSQRILGAQLFLSFGPGERAFAEPEAYLSLAEGPPNPERARAFEDHLGRMRRWERRFRPLYEDGQFSALDFLEIQARRLQAEQWLARESSRP